MTSVAGRLDVPRLSALCENEPFLVTARPESVFRQ